MGKIIIRPDVHLRVRKLTGKPGGRYTHGLRVRSSPHPESDYAACLQFLAVESRACRTHSDLLCGDLAIAACNSLSSSGDNRAITVFPRFLAFGSFGLPILVLINTFGITKIIVDGNILCVLHLVNIKDCMANNLPFEKKVSVISMLAEGTSIRAIERITGINRNTIMNLGLRVGKACKAILDEKCRGISARQIEVDEIWGFVGAKRRNAARAGAYGDVWTFIALDADTKLIPSFVIGKRDLYHARAFMEDLAGRLSRRVQLSSDALNAYPEAVERGFGAEVDYAQLVKTYAVVNLNKDAASRYSPAEVVSIEKTVIQGMPDITRVTTSHVEKQNHTLRMHCRRLTRLTNAFSKKLENFEAAVALNFAYYNFCKFHGALKMTPAMAAGIESTFWTVEDLVKRCGEL